MNFSGKDTTIKKKKQQNQFINRYYCFWDPQVSGEWIAVYNDSAAWHFFSMGHSV